MHLLVASYLNYQAPADAAPAHAYRAATDTAPINPIDPRRTLWMDGMGAIPASEELRNAAGAAQGLAALERMFFGTLKEI